MQFKKVTHVIFDMDGLLLESESIYDKIINDIVMEHGKRYTDDVKVKVLGTPELDTASIVVKELSLPVTPLEFLAVYKRKQMTELGDPPLLPGVERLVRHLHGHGVPIAVATSSSRESMELKTSRHRAVFDLFDHIVCGSTDEAVKMGKPAPDIFLVCAERFPDKPDPSSCIVFEDAPNGVKGAQSAGMQSVMVPAPYIPEELKKNATLVLDSLVQFKPELFGLPPFE
ncbi:unnamed protein product [Phyllotreta striolata]|uniref:Pseudouridine-5'-phosphatase n=1 Tax=Phyllotreta striolata TaxID=444603 RepID=A0A9N9TKF3_PHYSR|nr:unnamed protein product [Phyllotreta striolata]